MALEIGSRLGHYNVTALIGEGGMGQVYQATDTKLSGRSRRRSCPRRLLATNRSYKGSAVGPDFHISDSSF